LRTRIDEAYAKLDAEIAVLAAEITASGDDKFQSSRLKSRAGRAVPRFLARRPEGRARQLLESIAQTDGTIRAEERALHDELRAYFDADATLVPPPPQTPPADLLKIEAPQTLALARRLSHPLLDAIEQPYATDPAALHNQLTSDYNLIFGAINVWERNGPLGNGRLVGVNHPYDSRRGTHLLHEAQRLDCAHDQPIRADRGS